MALVLKDTSTSLVYKQNIHDIPDRGMESMGKIQQE